MRHSQENVKGLKVYKIHLSPRPKPKARTAFLIFCIETLLKTKSSCNSSNDPIHDIRVRISVGPVVA